jgi:hypothetical protein
MSLDPTCLFDVDEDLILTLEATFGPPIDSYLSGWQVWIEPSGLVGRDGEPVELEHRLHPPAGFRVPEGISHHDLWDAAVEQIAAGERVLRLGEEERRVQELWVLLEIYPGFGDPLTPDDLRRDVEARLGRAALAAGHVDHGRLGARWKRSKGAYDLAGALREQLGVT